MFKRLTKRIQPIRHICKRQRRHKQMRDREEAFYKLLIAEKKKLREREAMTKQAFWTKVGDTVNIATDFGSCKECCPAYDYFAEHGINCKSISEEDCINVIQHVYERLERENND